MEDAVSRSPSGNVVFVAMSDGTWLFRVGGTWSNKVPPRLSFKDIEDFDSIEGDEAAKLSTEARNWLSSNPAVKVP